MIKKIVTFSALFMALGFFTQAQAQFILGASYEIRSEEPTNGFGLHFQNDFSVVPMLLNVGVRFQTSFYSEEYRAQRDGFEIEQDDTVYDFGLGVFATINAGFLSPYIGAGAGYEILDRETGLINDVANNIIPGSSSDDSFYYFGAAGVGLSIVPVIRPFLEYRYRGVTSTEFMPSEYGTWAFGIQLRL